MIQNKILLSLVVRYVLGLLIYTNITTVCQAAGESVFTVISEDFLISSLNILVRYIIPVCTLCGGYNHELMVNAHCWKYSYFDFCSY